jgi:hypothetical protein
MSLRPGLRVRISPSVKDRLPWPFGGYAATGRVGVLTEEVESGAWRVAFEPIENETKTSYIVLRYRELIDADPRRASSNPKIKARARPTKKRRLMAWLS